MRAIRAHAPEPAEKERVSPKTDRAESPDHMWSTRRLIVNPSPDGSTSDRIWSRAHYFQYSHQLVCHRSRREAASRPHLPPSFRRRQAMTTHERRGVQGASGRHALGRRRHAADSCAVVRVRLLRRGYGDSTDGSPGAVGGSLATRTAFGPEPIISSIRTSSYALAMNYSATQAGGEGKTTSSRKRADACWMT